MCDQETECGPNVTGWYHKKQGVLGIGVCGNEVFRMDTDKVTVNKPLELNENTVSIPTSENAGRLYKKKGTDNLIWSTTKYGEFILNKDTTYPLHGQNGSANSPTYTFDTDTKTGIYKSKNGVAISVGGVPVADFSTNSVSLMNPLEICNSTVNNILDNANGYLYKKSEDNDLYWHTVGGEINLCQDNTLPVATYPDNIIAKSYSFMDDSTTSIYSSGVGNVTISSNNIDVLKVSNNEVSVNTTVSVKGSINLADGDENQLLDKNDGMLYKKTNDVNLYWKTADGGVVDLTANDFAGGELNCPLSLVHGSVETPGLAFLGDNSTGLYLHGPKSMAYACGGVKNTIFNENGLLVNDGVTTSPAYSFITDSSTGLSYKSSNGDDGKPTIVVSVDGEEKLSVGTNNIIGYTSYKSNVLGKFNDPAYGFNNLPNTGIYATDNEINIEVDKQINFQINTLNNLDVVTPNTIASITLDGLNINSAKNILLSSESVVIADVPDNTLAVGVSTNTDLRLASKDSTGNKTTYSGSVSFVSGNNPINCGDVVGIVNDNSGKIDRVSGGLWSNEKKKPNTDNSDDRNSIVDLDKPEDIINQSSLWDNFDNQYDLHLSTSTCVNEEGLSVLTLTVATTDSTTSSNIVSQCKTLDLMSCVSDHPKTSSVVIVKVDEVNHRYIVIYGCYETMADISFKKIKVDVVEGVPLITLESTYMYTPNTTIETFNAVYENSGSLDILTLVMYSSKLNNFEGAMFAVHPDNDSQIDEGYKLTSFSSDLIMGNNKTLCTILLPGQVVVCSYGNNKTFLLLPSEHTSAFNVGDTIMDTDSTDCIDMVFDPTNAVIVSVEKTISDTAFLQILDIFGTKIDIVRSKKLGTNSVTPIGLGYNNITDNFILFFSENDSNGQIKALVFTHDGEQINLGSVYPKNSVSNLYTIPTNSNMVNIPNHGRRVYMRKNNQHTLDWAAGDTYMVSANFDDTFGIQSSAFIGLANENVVAGEKCEVILRGQIYYNSKPLPAMYVGKKLYLDSYNLTSPYPDNLTTASFGNAVIGTLISTNMILVGL